MFKKVGRFSRKKGSPINQKKQITYTGEKACPKLLWWVIYVGVFPKLLNLTLCKKVSLLGIG